MKMNDSNSAVSQPNCQTGPALIGSILLKSLVGLALMLPAVPGVRAQTEAPAAAPTDFSDVEAFLKRSEQDRSASVADQIQALNSLLDSLVASDDALVRGYKNAYEYVTFGDDRAKTEAWEQKNQDLLKSDNFTMALRLHVQYLNATLAKRGGNDEAATALVKKWIDDMSRLGPKFTAVTQNSPLTEGVAKSVFLGAPRDEIVPSTHRVTTVGVKTPTQSKKSASPATLLLGLKKWYVGNLANLPEIHRVNVIDYLRSRKDPKVFDEWSYNIRLEQDAMERSGVANPSEAFVTQRRPWILWQIGKDYALYNRPREAVNVMVTAIKESPQCGDYEAIVAEIKRVIAEAKSKPMPTPVAPPTVSGPPRKAESTNPAAK